MSSVPDIDKSLKFWQMFTLLSCGFLAQESSGEFQVTVCGITVCQFSRHKDIRGPNAFETRLKCICHEITLSVTRQTCTWNCPGLGDRATKVKSKFSGKYFVIMLGRSLILRVVLEGRAIGDAPKVTEPNLRFPAAFCENLRFSTKICGFLRPPNAGISRRRGESAKICGFLRISAFWVLSVTFVPSP